MRIILYTGKGGVGKTTVAAATALRCAQRGHKTLVMSTDPAHSLGDALETRIGPEAVKITDNLYAQEVEALHEIEKHWSVIHSYMAQLLATQGLGEIVAEEIATPPGMEEIASLMWIRQYAKTKEYEVLVVDCAPTGETLQLLSFPEAARWWLDKIFPWERRAMKVARPVLQPLIDVPLPGDEIFESAKELLTGLDSMRSILSDTSITTVRLVLNLENMVIKEAKRAYTYLSLFGYITDAVIVNRVLPQNLTEDFFAGWIRVQKRYEEEVERAFSPLPILHVPLFEEEVTGIRMLSRMANEIYGDRDPADRMFRDQPHKVEKHGDEYILRIKLPFAEKDEIQLARDESELFVTVGGQRHDISLPRVLLDKQTLGAKLEGGELWIRFGKLA